MIEVKNNNGIDVSFEDLSYEVKFRKGTKRILHDISGTFKGGNLIAILGPSGAGKSTLLNALSGFVTKGVTGNISVNGKARNLHEFKKMSCYITQDNDLNGLLTVEENMKFAADLKLGNNTSDAIKKDLINNILNIFGLAKIKKSRTSCLSGGQMKRLSVALELISNPMIIFLDEPTTGLDSYSSQRCIEYLQQLAALGKTIICTIHQPSAKLFTLFDQVYVLARGKCLYNGNTDNMVQFLSSIGIPCNIAHNPADYGILKHCFKN